MKSHNFFFTMEQRISVDILCVLVTSLESVISINWMAALSTNDRCRLHNIIMLLFTIEVWKLIVDCYTLGYIVCRQQR